MKQKEVFNKIGGIIQELSDQYEYLKAVDEDLNDLELELFAANAHFLTDHIEVLYKLNLQGHAEKRGAEKTARSAKTEKKDSNAEPTAVHEPKYFEPVVQQMKPGSEKQGDKDAEEAFKPAEHEIVRFEKLDQPVPEIDLAAEVPADTYSYIRQEPETIRHELILDEAMDLEDEDEKPDTESGSPVKKRKRGFGAADEIAVEMTAQKPKDAKQASDTPAGPAEEEVLTINQKMSQAAEKNASRTEQLGIKPISDIKLAITLNDKLLYVKDLFNGYNLAYSEAIEILNRFTTFDEAARFLKTNYVTKNNWESKPATVDKFYALLKRRYA
jgi:hypothetical protein